MGIFEKKKLPLSASVEQVSSLGACTPYMVANHASLSSAVRLESLPKARRPRRWSRRWSRCSTIAQSGELPTFGVTSILSADLVLPVQFHRQAPHYRHVHYAPRRRTRRRQETIVSACSPRPARDGRSRQPSLPRCQRFQGALSRHTHLSVPSSSLTSALQDSGKKRKPLFKQRPEEDAYDISRFQPSLKYMLEVGFSLAIASCGSMLSLSLFPGSLLGHSGPIRLPLRARRPRRIRRR